MQPDTIASSRAFTPPPRLQDTPHTRMPPPPPRGSYLLSICLRSGGRLIPLAGSPLTVLVGVAQLEDSLGRWFGDAPPTSAGPVARAAPMYGHSAAALAFLGKVLRAWKSFVGRSLLARMLLGPSGWRGGQASPVVKP